MRYCAEFSEQARAEEAGNESSPSPEPRQPPPAADRRSGTAGRDREAVFEDASGRPRTSCPRPRPPSPCASLPRESSTRVLRRLANLEGKTILAATTALHHPETGRFAPGRRSWCAFLRQRARARPVPRQPGGGSRGVGAGVGRLAEGPRRGDGERDPPRGRHGELPTAIAVERLAPDPAPARADRPPRTWSDERRRRERRRADAARGARSRARRPTAATRCASCAWPSSWPGRTSSCASSAPRWATCGRSCGPHAVGVLYFVFSVAREVRRRRALLPRGAAPRMVLYQFLQEATTMRCARSWSASTSCARVDFPRLRCRWRA
jgi:hypothetical protein